MSPSDDRLADWFLWFRENVNRGRDYGKEIEFLHKALEGLMECVIILRAEQRVRLDPGLVEQIRVLHQP